MFLQNNFFKRIFKIMLRAFKYAGSKNFLISRINELLINKNYSTYIEPFLGSGSIFYNINYPFSKYIINDLDFTIYLMHNAIKESSYDEYFIQGEIIKNNFGDIKHNKEAWYTFRNSWNTMYWKNIQNKIFIKEAGLQLLYLASSCINSMFRFGPNGMNQSWGNRLYIISNDQFNNLKEKLKNTKLMNTQYQKILTNNIIYKNCFLFLDPPYVLREMPYNNGFNLNEFINKLQSLKCENTMICYTDIENEISDNLLNYGFSKEIIREMQSISPNRKNNEITRNEVMYYKNFFKNNL